MSRIKILHVAPLDKNNTGIATHADLIDIAFTRYLSDEIELYRVDGKSLSRLLYDIPQETILLAEMGSNEGPVFHALFEQKRKRPSLRRIIIVHDPPYFVLSYFPILDRLALLRVGRAIRRVFKTLFGELIEARFVGPSDIYVCKTAAGVEVLQNKLNKLSKAPPPVFYVPHPNYLDKPVSPQNKANSISPKIGFFGFILPHKGIHILIDAVIALSVRLGVDAVPRIEIRGKPKTREAEIYLNNLKEKVRGSGLIHKITFEGFVPESEIESFICGLDALALPYLNEETISASGPLGWAISCGIPVIANHTRAMGSLITDGVDGRLIPLNQSELWVNALEEVATRSSGWRKLYEGVKRRQQQSSWKAIARCYYELICRQNNIPGER